MIRMYMTRGTEITEAEVEKTSDHYVWRDGKKYERITEDECYFDTRTEAEDYIIEQAEQKVIDLCSKLEEAKNRLRKVREEYP